MLSDATVRHALVHTLGRCGLVLTAVELDAATPDIFATIVSE